MEGLNLEAVAHWAIDDEHYVIVRFTPQYEAQIIAKIVAAVCAELRNPTPNDHVPPHG